MLLSVANWHFSMPDFINLALKILKFIYCLAFFTKICIYCLALGIFKFIKEKS